MKTAFNEVTTHITQKKFDKLYKCHKKECTMRFQYITIDSTRMKTFKH